MKPSASKLSLYTCIMSKATFPNTTRRRLASCVVCRLSSSGAAFFFRMFFIPRPVTPLGQEASQARSLQLLFTADDRAEGPVAGGAARPVAGATDEDAGPVADDNAEGPVADVLISPHRSFRIDPNHRTLLVLICKRPLEPLSIFEDPGIRRVV